MLLAIDVGNTNIVVGVYDVDGAPSASPAGPKAHFRLDTRASRTSDEYAALLAPLFQMTGLSFADVSAIMVSTVVPAVQFPIQGFCDNYLHRAPLWVGPGIKTGISILCDNPREVGADRIVNAVAAHARWTQGAVIVDFGTATTFDVITPRGDYAGGIIAPGLMVSADALYNRTAKLPRVEIARPKTAIGKNTVASLQSGLLFGYAGLVDALVTRIRAEVDFQPRVVATGGLAPMVAAEATTIDECDDMLTLDGLRLLYERNR
ncbi:MAG TPA: type III pantothenate kinase [Polyangia bacterium]|jgi:type III pantothenate kinase